MTLSRCAKIGFVSVTILGVVLIIVGTTVNVLFPGIYKKEVEKNLVLKENTEALERFVKPPVPIYMTFYFFNVTNPDEVNDRTQIPKLQEIGPIVYREEKVKSIKGWNVNGTLNYVENTKFFFEPELTKVDINDEIYHPNAPDLGLGKMLVGGTGTTSLNYFNMLTQMNIGFDGPAIIKAMGPLIVKNTMSQILFEGYDVPVFNVMKNLKLNIPKEMEAIIFAMLGGKTIQQYIMEKLPPDLKFSALGDKNNTNGPLFTISSGQAGMHDFTEIQELDEKSTLGFFQKDTWCDMINGTDGMQFPPDVKKDKYLFVYAPDVCRSLQFEYKENIKLRDIEAYRFVLSESVFEDPNANNSENVCFCKEKKKEECTKKGLLPVIYCMPNKPILAMSAPHFLNADDEYLNGFEGLTPNASIHESFLDIDPGAEIDKPNADDFHSRVLAPKQAASWGTIAVIAIGAVLILMTIVVYFMKH